LVHDYEHVLIDLIDELQVFDLIYLHSEAKMVMKTIMVHVIEEMGEVDDEVDEDVE
jgi:hypothetical protein